MKKAYQEGQAARQAGLDPLASGSGAKLMLQHGGSLGSSAAPAGDDATCCAQAVKQPAAAEQAGLAEQRAAEADAHMAALLEEEEEEGWVQHSHCSRPDPCLLQGA